jgi:DNA-binding NarL/FixJ family response regulator
MIRQIYDFSSTFEDSPPLQAGTSEKVMERVESGEDRNLTRRERQIIRLYSEGMFDKQIGRRLGLAASTVRSHLASVCNKLGASHRLQCGIILERIGITRDINIPPQDPK